MIRKAPLPIQFSGGIETKTDEKQVPTTKLLNLENAQFIKGTTLAKRNGYEALGRTLDESHAEYMSAVGMASRDDELIVFTDGHAVSHRASSDTWSDTGEVSSIIASGRPTSRTGTQQWCPDMATAQGITVCAWEDSRSGIRCTVVEDVTGREIVHDAQLDSSSDAVHPRCVVSGGILLVLWARRTSNLIRVCLINPAAPDTLTTSTLTNDLDNSEPFFDAESCGNAVDAAMAAIPRTGREPAIIAWARNGGGFRVGYLTSGGVLGSPATGFPSVVTYATDVVSGPIAVTVDRGTSNGLAAVVWGSNTGLRTRFLFQQDLSTNRGPVVVGSGATLYYRATCCFGASVNGGQVLYWAADTANNPVTDPTHNVYVEAGYALEVDSSSDSLFVNLRGHALATRAFRDGPTVAQSGTGISDSNVLVGVVHAVRNFPYIAVVRLDGSLPASGSVIESTCVARLLPGQSSGMLARRVTPTTTEYIQHLPSVQDTGTGGTDANAAAIVLSRQHRMPLSYRIQLDSTNGDQFGETGIIDMSLDFDHPAAFQAVQLGRGLYLASANPLAYDGDRWSEAEYHCAPDVGTSPAGVDVSFAASFTPSASGGSMSDGTYLYKLWYEDIDAAGEVHRGPTSVGILKTLSGGGSSQSVSIAIPTYRLTSKRRVRLCVARSKAGATGTDSQIPLFRCTSTDPSITTGANCFVFNDTTVDTVTFVDGLSDTTLGAREPLYTNGGILSNDPSPWAGNAIAGGKSRLFWTDPIDPNLVRFSQQLAEDTGMEASPRLVSPCDPYGGAIVAISTMDETVVAFKETALYGFTGPGPLANPSADPAQYAFSPAELVTSDVGCISPKSVCQSPMGLAFQSQKGIKLLDRSLQIQDIGSSVYALNDQTVTRATLLPDRHQIVFLTGDGTTLLWDYERNQWSKWTNHEGFDACVVDGLYHYLRTDGRVFRETPGLYQDDNSHIPMVIETAWIKLAGYLQGWQRILWAYIIGTWKSSHTLSVKWRIDYNAGYSAPVLMDVDTNYNPSDYGEDGYGDGPYGGSEGDTTRYQRRIHLNRRCQAIQFRIEDVEATDAFGAAFELSELLLIGGVLSESFKPGPARTN